METPATISQRLKEKRELHGTIRTQLEAVGSQVKALAAEKSMAEQRAQAAADGVLLGSVSPEARDAAREQRDRIGRELQHATEDLEAAKRIEPKIAAEVRRLETQLEESVQRKTKQRLAELQEEVAARLADLIPEAAALSRALGNIGPLANLIGYKLPVPSDDAALATWREIRTKWINGEE